jgi:hypothetical protein
MKNLKSILKLFVLALAALLIASCSNSFDVAEGATGDSAQAAGHVRVVLGSVVSKTILPDAWTSAKEGALTYYLSGTGTLSDAGGSEKTLALTKLDFDKITGTGQEIELSPGTWSLTLSAYQLAAGDDPAATNMVLTATNTGIDLTTSGSTQAFNLKPVATTNATGTVSITGSVNCGPYLKYVVQDVGTYAGTTFTSAASGAYKVTTDVSASTATSTSLTFTYNKDVVAASNYYYVVDFYNGDPDSGGESLGHYREALIVDGGNTSSETITLGDFLNSPATNPTQLSVDTSFTNVGQASNAAVPNTFLATFKWNDQSGNETGFELKIFKGTVSGGVTKYPTTDAYTIKKGEVTLGTAAGEVKANSNVDGTADPTMGKNETQASVYLETGYTYKASIRAYNRYDELDTTDIGINVTKVNNVTGTDMVYGMFTVAYTLGDANAFVKTGADAADKDESAMYVIGYNYSTEAQDLLGYVASGGSSTSYPYVTISAATMKFIKWITTVASQTSDQMDAAEAVTSIAANNITNLKLTGVWKSVANVSVVFPDYSSLRSSVWIKSYKVGAATAVTVDSNKLVHISATTGDTIVLTYDEAKVDSVAATVSNGRDSATATVDTTAHTVTFNTTGLTSSEGHWYLTVNGTGAYTDAGETQYRQVSQEFDITLN